MSFNFSTSRLLIITTIFSLLISSCSSSRYSQSQDSGPDGDVDVSDIANPVPRAEPRSKYGNSPSYVVLGKRYYVMENSDNFSERGIASWYGNKFHGHRTSNGETYDMYQMTAAHKNLPLPSYVEVTNLNNDRSVIVRVNDRGPFHHNRIIDLSYAAAKKLGITAKGTGMVEIRVIKPGQPSKPRYAQNTSTRQTVRHNINKNEHRLFLQVGAFISRTNAEQLRSRLLSEIDSLNVNTGYSEEKNIYRVRIGPLSSVEQADKLATQIADLGFNEPHIVID